MPGIDIGGILPRGQPAGSQVALQRFPRDAEQRPDPGTPTGSHPRQTGRPAPPKQPEQDRLGLVIGMMRQHDRRRVGCGSKVAQCRAARPAGPGLRAIGAKDKPDATKGEATLHREPGHLLCNGSTLIPDAMIDMPDQQLASMDRTTLMQKVEQRHGIRTT